MVNELITRYNLQAHPEGGFYAETYRAQHKFESIETSDFPAGRNYGTAIYFLLVKDSFSAFHKIKSDEVWHFYLGSPIEIIEITPDGNLIKTVLGADFKLGQVFQYTVMAGNWFASRVLNNDAFGFVGCTVAPGFSFEDFHMPSRQEMLLLFPQHSAVINELTRQI